MTHHADHHRHDATTLSYAVLTVSDTRTPDDDASGGAAVSIVTGAGHRVARRGLVPDDTSSIHRWVREAALDDDVDVVVVTGGTGVGERDVTPEAVVPLFTKEVPGFGEAFRRLSVEDVGPVGLLSRATAGLLVDTPIFLLPGSPAAVRLAMTRLVMPLAGHLVGLTRPERGPPGSRST